MRRSLACLLSLSLATGAYPAWGASRKIPSLPAALPQAGIPAALASPPPAAAAQNPAAPLVAPPQAPASTPAQAAPRPGLEAPGPRLEAALKAIADKPEAPAASQHAAGAALEAAVTGEAPRPAAAEAPAPEPAEEVLGEVTLQEGTWRVTRRDPLGLSGQTAAALRRTRKAGLVIPQKKVSIVLERTNPSTPSGLKLELPLLLGLLDHAKAQDRTLEDKLVQFLVRISLMGALEPLRHDLKETEKLGLAPEKALTATEALAVHRERRLEHFDRLLERLRREFPHRQTVSLRFPYERMPAVHVDPASRSLITVTGTGRVRVRKLRADGSVDPSAAEAEMGLGLVAGSSSFDPASRTLWVTGLNEGAETALPIGPKGELGEPSRKPVRFHVFDEVLARSPELRLAAVGTLERALFLYGLREDGSIGEAVASFTPPHRPWKWAASFDPAAGTLIAAGDERLQVWNLKSSGDKPLQDMARNGRPGGDKMVFDAKTRTLFLTSGKDRVESYRVDGKGRVARTPFLSLQVPEEHLSSLSYDPAAKALYIGTQRTIHVFHADPEAPAEADLPSEPVLDALAARVPEAGEAESEAIAGVLRSAMAKNIENFSWIHGVWDRLARGVLAPAPERQPLRRINHEWFRESKAMLQARMPEFWKLLVHPAKLARLLNALSFLRLAIPYHVGIAKPGTAWELAWKTMAAFPLGGLVVTPITQSFRRHVITAPSTGDEAPAMVELKIPGQEKGRDMIFDAHFQAAKELWDAYPEEPGVVEPLVFGTFQGKLRMYGKLFSYTRGAPLGVMVFRHEDGTRLRHVGAAVPSFAEAAGKDPAAYIRDARADAAAAAIKLHRLGWKGSAEGGNDMHDENVRVLKDGRAILVGDFGAFEKASLTPKQRAAETLMLIGLDPATHRALIEELVPLVVERLTRGVSEPSERARVESEVLAELGLSAPSATP